MTASEFVERGFLGWASGIAGVLALLVMPLASCGPVSVKGHEILRNKSPVDLGETSGRGHGRPMFDPEDRWLIGVYAGAVVCAAAGPVLSGSALCLAAGVVGATLLAAFLIRFGGLLEQEGGTLELEEGTYLAVLSFVGLVAQGAARLRRRVRR